MEQDLKVKSKSSNLEHISNDPAANAPEIIATATTPSIKGYRSELEVIICSKRYMHFWDLIMQLGRSQWRASGNIFWYFTRSIARLPTGRKVHQCHPAHENMGLTQDGVSGPGHSHWVHSDSSIASCRNQIRGFGPEIFKYKVILPLCNLI